MIVQLSSLSLLLLEMVLSPAAAAQSLTASLPSDTEGTSSKDDYTAGKCSMVPHHPWASEVELVLTEPTSVAPNILTLEVQQNKGGTVTVGCQ